MRRGLTSNTTRLRWDDGGSRGGSGTGIDGAGACPWDTGGDTLFKSGGDELWVER